MLNQPTYSTFANLPAWELRLRPVPWLTSDLNKRLVISATALLWLSPTLLQEGAIPDSAKRSRYRIVSIGRRYRH